MIWHESWWKMGTVGELVLFAARSFFVLVCVWAIGSALASGVRYGWGAAEDRSHTCTNTDEGVG